jgi:uncharacterized protein YndB with AHSA1/START domain
MQRVEITHEFALPVERVYAYLAEHENVGMLFGATISRVRDGDTSRNGVGSIRRLKVGALPPFEETITRAVQDELIEYRITKGGPLRDHVGIMTFSDQGGGSRLHYVIEFGSVVPGVDRVVKASLDRSIPKGLCTVEKQA